MTEFNLVGYYVKYNPNNDPEIVSTSVLFKNKNDAMQWVAKTLKPNTNFKLIPKYRSGDHGYL